MSHKIIPAILDQNIDEVGRKLDLVKAQVDLIHIDILDGIFADNLTIGVSDLAQIEIPEKIKFDYHLMVEYPEDLLGECHTNHGYRILAQIERMHSQSEYVSMCQELKMLPGMALDLYTPIEAIQTQLVPQLDGILLMGVKAGWSGQSFEPQVLEKIKQLRDKGYSGHIIMDGGMNHQTAKQCVEAGADEIAVTSYLWKSANPLETLKNLREL